MIGHFFLNIFFAFLGGLIMNFMPCILPLISLKVSSFLKQSDCRKTFVNKNLYYISGILSFFLLFGVLLIVLKSSGVQIVVGSHMQSGVVLLVIFTILLLIGFNLSGLYEINFSGVVSKTGEIESKLHHGKIGDYFNGFFVSLLAIPCTAPFISTALTYGLTASNGIFFSIILFMGIGFAFPFICTILFSEKILSILPKPGSWMVKFKELLAFPIYATAGWILFVLIRQDQHYYSAVAIFIVLFLLFFFWLYQNFEKVNFFYKAAILALALSLGYFILPREDIASKKVINNDYVVEYGKKSSFSYEKLNEALKNKQKVFVVVSASWCITCNVNEKNALSSEKFYDSLKDRNILYLYADMTNENEEASKFLKEHNKIGIPFYLLFGSDGSSHGLPQILNEDMVLKEFENLK